MAEAIFFQYACTICRHDSIWNLW